MLTLTIQEKVSREQLNTLPCGLYELSEPPKQIKEDYYDIEDDVMVYKPKVVRNFARIMDTGRAVRCPDEVIIREDGNVVFIVSMALERWQPKDWQPTPYIEVLRIRGLIPITQCSQA